ncbi:hypothetical protein ASF56_24310 [Methylobacterium sp. Leaf122]|nr:hypothetical protein [Methylobacterium sp. Leaf122]KQQ14381.1 hypothetical protein ASF56_24310 [Methylobacterium sp. Leaf122]
MADPQIPEHTIKPDGPGRLVVTVGRDIAGHVSEEPERPGLWIITDQNGSFMGRVYHPDKGAAFLASWFIASDEDQT